MNRKALSSIAALALLGTTAAARAQTAAPAPHAPPAVAAPPAQHAPAEPDLDVLPAIADAPDAPDAPEAPDMPDAPDAPDAPDELDVPDVPDAPEALPALPQEPAPAPAPPAVATTFFVSGNFLGVRTEEVTRENMQRYGLSGEPRGVGIREVVKGSPAEKAGLRANDVIVRFDGEPVTSVRKLTRLIQESAPDHAARVTVLRGGSEQVLSATLTRREPFVSAAGEGLFHFPSVIFDDAWRLGDEAARNSEQWKRSQEQMQRKWEEMARKHPRIFGGSARRIGVATNALGKQLAEYFGVTHGLLVSSVEAGSPAEKAGIRAGDIVTEADGQKVEDSGDLVRALSAKEEGEVTLTVVRDRNRRTVRVTPERRTTAPQGMFAPGAFRLLESPVAAVTLPRMQMHPDVLTARPVVVTPRLLSAPRIRATPRPRVFGLGDRVL
ncbi:MAG TPA: PDZ domain-containing protein [Pyrinomonadaceae bacterium]|nr:PDZ domain-containing protein [Pyrinomonadaceae bacterium]